MDLRGIGAFVGKHYTSRGDSLWRLEVLPHYIAKSDGDAYQQWLDGTLDTSYKQGLLDDLRRERAAGMLPGRTRILGDPVTGELTPYELFACQAGYALNAPAGEDVRIIRRTEHEIPAGIVHADFWLVNGTEVLLMDYDADGRFIKAEHLDAVDAAPYIETRRLLQNAGEPFGAWWARHPELAGRRAA